MRPLLSAAVLRSQTDERLVKLAREGHEQAFAAIVSRYRRELTAHARRVAPADRSEDVVQQAMLSAWSALGRQADVRDVRPWLHSIVHHAGLRIAAAVDRHDALDDAVPAAGLTDVTVEQRLDARAALGAVAALPDRQRRAFELTALAGASGPDAAAALGVSEGALRQLVHRARATLRSGIAGLIPGPVVSWAAAAGGGETLANRMTELGTGAGAAVTLGKLCATVAVTATVVGGAAQVLHVVHGTHPARRTAHRSRALTIATAPDPSAMRTSGLVAPAIRGRAPASDPASSADSQRSPGPSAGVSGASFGAAGGSRPLGVTGGARTGSGRTVEPVAVGGGGGRSPVIGGAQPGGGGAQTDGESPGQVPLSGPASRGQDSGGDQAASTAPTAPAAGSASVEDGGQRGGISSSSGSPSSQGGEGADSSPAPVAAGRD